MERSMTSEPATRSVSTVATDHVGVSASDRISPASPAAAAAPSPPAICPLKRQERDSPILLFLPKNRPHCNSAAQQINQQGANQETAETRAQETGFKSSSSFFFFLEDLGLGGGAKRRYALHCVAISAAISLLTFFTWEIRERGSLGEYQENAECSPLCPPLRLALWSSLAIFSHSIPLQAAARMELGRTLRQIGEEEHCVFLDTVFPLPLGSSRKGINGSRK